MKKILKEDTVLPVTEIDEETKQVLVIFQEMLRTLHKFFHGEYKSDKRGHLNSLRDFKKFKQELKRFHNYPFIGNVIAQIDSMNKDLIELIQSKREDKKLTYQSLSPDIAKAKAAWKSGDRHAVKQASQMLIKKMYVFSKAKNSERDALKSYHNPVYIENPLIFQTRNFLRTFEQRDIEEVMDKNLNEFKYSYLKLPASRFSDFQYIAYFILKLRNKAGEVELSNSDLNKYFDMAYSNDDYADLTQKVKSYLSNNDKSLIPEIVEGLKKFPEILKANKASLSKIDSVYRGIPVNDYDEDEEYKSTDIEDIIAQDKKASFVATSTSYDAAKRFALQIGHLEDEDNRRSDSGVVITYAVNKDSLILDTSIFGGIFNEDEIIINPKKAEVDDYNFV